MAEREEGFLSRWSRLKRAEEERKSAPVEEEAEAAAESPVSAPAELPEDPGAGPAAAAPDPNADLPPIETLDRYADYTVFMREGVSPELRRQALAKLWRSDPVFANLDGLVEYGEDYSLPFKTPPLVSTIYQVGKGMVESAVAEPDAAEPLPAGAETPAVASDESASHDGSASAKTAAADRPAGAESDEERRG